jgi:AcrR family transcriptional regulator
MTTNAPRNRQRRPRRDARRNRELLVATAREVLSEGGLEASLEEVARRAELSIGTLYNHFPSRTDLIDAALAERIRESVANVERALEQPDPWTGLVDHLTTIAEWSAEDRGFAEACVHTLPADSEMERAKARGHALTERLVARAQEAGALRADIGLPDLGLLISAVVDATEGIRATAPDMWRRHLAVLFDGLRADAAHPLPGPAPDPDEVAAAMTFSMTGRPRR